MSQIINNCNHSIIQLTDGDSYTILAHDGSFKSFKYRDSAAAFKTNMAIKITDDEISIIPGIALRPNYNQHQLVHELLHVISSRQHNYFNEDGIAYTKTGTKIDYFDKSLNECNMDSTPSSDGLNEGITEFLTSKITNVYTGNYPAYLAVASMLMACNDKLLTAYFSEDTKELEAFYDDLEEKQSVITRDNLCNLSSKELSDDELIKLIVGALKYNGAYNNTINIVEVSNYLDKFYMLDSGSWMNLILESVDKFEKIDSDTPISR